MSVWFVLPSIRPPAEASACLSKWRAMGYKIALLRQGEPIEADLLIPTGEYLGWARSTNLLCKRVLEIDPMMRFCVGGGDDYWPVPDRFAPNIGFECFEHFDGTYGVVQMTGDRWGDNESSRKTFGQNRGAEIDRVAGSPWMGREWCERAYQGNGPMFDGYHHIYADEELQCVAEAQGVFWQRPDLCQYHDHPSRKEGGPGYMAYLQGHLAPLYSQDAWDKAKTLFEDRKLKGFPGSEPCPPK